MQTYAIVVADIPELDAFVEGVVRWCRTGSHAELLTLVRLSCSGVPHDVAAAYATLAARTGSLLDAIDRGRLALPAAERDAVLHFAERLRRLRASAEQREYEPLRAETLRVFELTDAPRRPWSVPDTGDGFELAEPCMLEEPTGVRAPQRHFSASALNAYAECARKWFYRYACAAIEDPGSSAASYGTAFHLALEDFHGEFPRPAAEQETLMRRRVRECVTWAFERNRDGFATAVEFELQRRRARRTAQRYVDWLLAAEREAPFEVVGRELAANLELGGHAFVGYIDRLDRDLRDDGVGVVDYKTGSIATSAAEYREKVRRLIEFQLPFYYWARTAAGDRVTRLALIPLKDALADVRPIVLEVVDGSVGQHARDRARTTGAISTSDLERAKARMIEHCDALDSGTLERFAVASDPAACTYCAYALACAKRPAEAPERFAR